MTDLGARFDAALAKRESELLAFVRELISVDSQIPPYGDERNIAALVRARMNDLGLGEAEVPALRCIQASPTGSRR